MKAKSLYLQVEKLRQNLNKLESTISAVQQVLEEGRALDILLARDRMLAQVQELKTVRSLLQPQEDDRVMFTPPDQALYLAIKSFGFVSSGAFAPLTKATGDGLKRALQGKVASFTVIGYDHDGEPRLSGGDLMSAVVLGPDGNLFGAEVSDQQNGTYVVSYRPQLEGEHLVSVTLCNQHIENSPFKVVVKSGRSYVGIGLPGLSFGSVMVRKILRREAPSVLASCSHLESSLLQCSPTMTVRRGMPSMRLMAEDLRNPAIWISAI